MVFVHVSRCLIFKVHWPCSLIEISVVSSVALNRGDYYIVAHRKANVKNFFCFSATFFSTPLGNDPASRSAPGYINTAFLICQQFFPFFAIISLIFILFFPKPNVEPNRQNQADRQGDRSHTGAGKKTHPSP